MSLVLPPERVLEPLGVPWRVLAEEWLIMFDCEWTFVWLCSAACHARSPGACDSVVGLESGLFGGVDWKTQIIGNQPRRRHCLFLWHVIQSIAVARQEEVLQVLTEGVDVGSVALPSLLQMVQLECELHFHFVCVVFLLLYEEAQEVLRIPWSLLSFP